MDAKVFKKSLFGLRKSDVLSYIDEMEDFNRRHIERLENQARDLKIKYAEQDAGKAVPKNNDALDEANAEIGRLKESVLSMENNVCDLREKLGQAEEKCDSLRAENEELARRIAEKESGEKTGADELERLRGENEALVKRVEDLEHNEIMISKVMLDAQETADNIILHAKGSAGKMRDETIATMKQIAGDADSFSFSITGIRERLQELSDDANYILDRMSSSCDAIRQNISSAEAETDKTGQEED